MRKNEENLSIKWIKTDLCKNVICRINKFELVFQLIKL